MSSIFILTHPVPDFHHVGIIPVIRTRMFAQVFLHIQNLQYAPGFPAAVVLYTIEAVINVARRTPEVAHRFSPLPWFIVAPFTETEDDWASGGEQRVAHSRIRALSAQSFGVAPIIFQIIDTPLSVTECILVLATSTARVTAASFRASIGIDTKFQPFRMYIIG